MKAPERLYAVLWPGGWLATEGRSDSEVEYIRADIAKEERESGWHEVLDWFREHQPTCEESFYQVNSVNEALPELGIAVMNALFTEPVKEEPDGE